MLVLPVSRHLSGERHRVTGSGTSAARRLHPVAITFDFGNTLVPVRRDALERVVERLAIEVDHRSGPVPRAAFLAAWREERVRQFAEEVPEGREVDLERRIVRVLARLRGMPPPAGGRRWDDAVAADLSDAAERSAAVEAYSAAFIAEIPAPAGVGVLLARLALHHRLGVLSNWPHATTIDRFLGAAGWSPFLRATIVSQRVGTIKPRPEIFRAAEAALDAEPTAILHVGDDWAADVVGAKRAGWLAAYLPGRQGDSPLPSSDPDDAVRADLVLDELGDLVDRLA